MKHLVVLSGAGMSAESGIRTFRDNNGLWEDHDVMEVASPQGWQRNPELVLGFYNARRKQLKKVEPNAAHRYFSDLEGHFEVTVVTQNVDDLHERAGSTQVVHLHGELKKVRSTTQPHLVYNWEEDLFLGDVCEQGGQLRPHIVWFGEEVPMLESAARVVNQADIVVIIGTSLQVYPAAALVGFATAGTPVFYIDPNPQPNYEVSRLKDLVIIPERATKGVTILDKYLHNE